MKDFQILNILKNDKISTKKAKADFSAHLENSNFDGIWSMKFEGDRVKFLRYLFTGCIFLEESLACCGNPTMFSQLNGYRKIYQFEDFFKSLDLRTSYLINLGKDLLFDELCSLTEGKYQSNHNI